MSYVIYGYKKIDINDFVYIGLTNNYLRRRKEHEQYEPFQKGRPHYNYPLSKGIRKYGLQAYSCEILEDNLTLEEAKRQEKHWIKFYNTFEDPTKYNYTPGGELTQWTKFSEENIELVKYYLEQNLSYDFIQGKTGISISHISEINTGKRRFDKNRKYPINELTQGKLLANNQIVEIIALLSTTDISCQEIALKYQVSASTIQNINTGKNYHQNDIVYPIRERVKPQPPHTITATELALLIEELQNTNNSIIQLAHKYNISVSTVNNINYGKTRKQPNLKYPLRK